MTRIIAVANQKGGVGKTTTAVNLAASLVAMKRRVLLVDLDPQGNATTGSGLDKRSFNATVYQVLLGERRIADVRVASPSGGFDLVPANRELAGAEIELVDLSPEDLLQRMAEGKVYVAERAGVARQHFFREGNLTALREIALRLAAERVGQDVRDFMQARQIAGPWKTNVKLLVAVGPSPYSAELIRWTRRAS